MADSHPTRGVHSEPSAGRESVWDYPRPPRLERTSRRVRVVLDGVTIADTRRALRVLETSHPPTYYIPPEDIRRQCLELETGTGSLCEWKGAARYVSVVASGRRVARAGWTYPRPSHAFAMLRDHVAFYAGKMDACFVDDEQVQPQPGGFYGGWITADIAGPFKGEPGTQNW